MKLLSDEAFTVFSIPPSEHVTAAPALDTLITVAIEEIATVDSASQIHTHLQDLITAVRNNYLKPTWEDRMKVEDAVVARTQETLADPELHYSFKDLWREWAKESFPYTLDKIARLPPAPQAASLPATSAILAP